MQISWACLGVYTGQKHTSSLIFVLYREIAVLTKQVKHFQSISCTKATILHTSKSLSATSVPHEVRSILWKDIRDSYKQSNIIGKGVFANCYLAELGSLKVCVKLLCAGITYKNVVFKECEILSQLCHYNLPWIHGFCDDSSHTAVIMTFHPYFPGVDSSLHIHDALHKHYRYKKMSRHNWKQVLLGCASALVYLQNKNILHNDIKSDNILIEHMPSSLNDVRAVLIDFNKACHLTKAQLYNLSPQDRQIYAKNHPQIAPEVCNGYQKQSYASDVYSVGRVIQKINCIILEVEYVNSLAQMCLHSDPSERPNANDLHTTFNNLLDA